MLSVVGGLWAKVTAPLRRNIGDDVLAQLPDPATYPTDEELNVDDDLNRHFAKHVRDHFSRNHSMAQQASVDISKWLLTSMLAVNAGGAAATTQIEIEPGLRVVAGAIFVVGIILPLISGYISTMNGMRIGGPMGRALGYWGGVEHNGVRAREEELEINQLAATAFSYMRWPYRLGAASIALFTIGSAIIGIGLLGSL